MPKYTRFSYAQQLFLIYVSLGDRPRPVHDEATLELESNVVTIASDDCNQLRRHSPFVYVCVYN